jgi:hypothetical protein
VPSPSEGFPGPGQALELIVLRAVSDVEKSLKTWTTGETDEKGLDALDLDDETPVVSQQRASLRGQQKDAPGKTVFVAFSSLNLFDEIKVVLI